MTNAKTSGEPIFSFKGLYVENASSQWHRGVESTTLPNSHMKLTVTRLVPSVANERKNDDEAVEELNIKSNEARGDSAG